MTKEKYPQFLDCQSNETIQECPYCRRPQKNQHEWPQAGTHVFTIPYECGTEIDYPIGHDGATLGVTCDGHIKRYKQPDIRKLNQEQKEKIFKMFGVQ